MKHKELTTSPTPHHPALLGREEVKELGRKFSLGLWEGVEKVFYSFFIFIIILFCLIIYNLN